MFMPDKPILTLYLACTLGACAANPPATQESTDFSELRLTAADLAAATNQSAILDDFDPADEVSWQVYIPDTGSDAAAPGLLVFISPSDSPGFPSRWLPILDEKNLVMMAPIRAGNRHYTSKRIALAVSGLLYFSQRYELDRSRFYLSGFSGGARVSGLTMALYPSLFAGAIYIGGAEMWPAETPSDVTEELGSRRFVFITGSDDFNRDMTRRVWGQYRKNGITESRLDDVRRLGHELPSASVFEQTISYLDGEGN